MKPYEKCCFSCGKFVSCGGYYDWPYYAKVFLCKSCLAKKQGGSK